jgi:hypothetical protein
MDVETTPATVEATLTDDQLVNELLRQLDEVTEEEIARDAEGVAGQIFSLLCPHCNKRRAAKAESMRKWRAKRAAGHFCARLASVRISPSR